MGLFLKNLAEHVSAFPNLSEKWRQFHFALVGQIRGPLANCFQLFAKQLRCGLHKSRVILFTNSGSRLQTFSFLFAFLRQSPLLCDGV